MSSPLRILIVDDEPLARERLRALLKPLPAEVVGECGSAGEAAAWFERNTADILFLDMQMPGGDGLQVARALPDEHRPAVVFVTAHEKFALDAFEVQAVDYLLKPFDRERFQQAFRRAQDYLQAKRAGALGQRLESLLASAAPTPRVPERLTVKADGRLVFVKPEDIVWIEAADNYVVLHLKDDRLMLRDTLSSLEERLGTTSFARVNRSAIVHLDQIKELQPTFHGDYVVILRPGTKLPLSRSLRGQLGNLVRGSL